MHMDLYHSTGWDELNPFFFFTFFFLPTCSNHFSVSREEGEKLPGPRSEGKWATVSAGGLSNAVCPKVQRCLVGGSWGLGGRDGAGG